MNGTDVELRKELWMWRGVGILLIILWMVVTVSTFIQTKKEQSLSGIEHAQAWQLIKSNQSMIIGKLDKHYDATIRVDEHLRQCANCHSHPDLTKAHK
jgi:hypothetical protein